MSSHNLGEDLANNSISSFRQCIRFWVIGAGLSVADVVSSDYMRNNVIQKMTSMITYQFHEMSEPHKNLFEHKRGGSLRVVLLGCPSLHPFGRVVRCQDNVRVLPASKRFCWAQYNLLPISQTMPGALLVSTASDSGKLDFLFSGRGHSAG